VAVIDTTQLVTTSATVVPWQRPARRWVHQVDVAADEPRPRCTLPSFEMARLLEILRNRRLVSRSPFLAQFCWQFKTVLKFTASIQVTWWLFHQGGPQGLSIQGSEANL
jgi:hypothetical protein